MRESHPPRAVLDREYTVDCVETPDEIGLRKMRILVLSRFNRLPFYGFGYGAAIERAGGQISYLPPDSPADIDVETLVALCPDKPSLIFCPDWHTAPLPPGLTKIDIPTVCVNEDTYKFTERRIKWSMLFDYTVTCHPGYAGQFEAAGHPRVLFLPLAVDRKLQEAPEEERIFELAAVGQTEGPLYATRKRVLQKLDGHFRTNDFWRRYSPQEMAAIYRRSKVVINIPREDFLQEANMRVFEVMGAGALLLTRMPTELTDMGFEEGVHFVGYRDESEVVSVVRHWLTNEAAGAEVAGRAQKLVWREHTYDNRLTQLLKRVKEDAGSLPAPARKWPPGRTAELYVDHYAGHGFLDRAHHELGEIAKSNPGRFLGSVQIVAGAHAGRALRRLLKGIRRG